MKHIIAISGKQYSGKDSLAKILLENLQEYRRVGLGDAIKIEYGKKNNLTFDEIEKNKHLYRDDLIKLGNWGRAQDSDYWLKNVIEYDKIIIPDVRVVHEVEFLKSYGAFLIRVEADEKVRASRGTIVNGSDYTETCLDNYKNWDIVVYNNSDYENLLKEANRVLDKYSILYD